MTPRIKICGITSLTDARYCSALGGDFLGFIQKADDDRNVNAATAREIIEWVVGPAAVGVFEDESVDRVLSTCADNGFTCAQLDGHEATELCSAIQAGGIPVIKTVCLRHDVSSEQLRDLILPYRGAAEFIRLDISESTRPGGEGWKPLRELASEFKLFLAGTITQSNVEQFMATVRPYAVDVSASVEESPGIKDFEKISALFDIRRGLEAEVA